MDAIINTLRDIRTHKDILDILHGHLPLSFINAVFNHMQSNQEDNYDHIYLKNYLKVVDRIIKAGTFEVHDKRLCYALACLMEAGRPLTKDYPYEVVMGVAWGLLRGYASELFDADDIYFISKSCKPVTPVSLRPSVNTRIILVCYEASHLAQVVGQNHRLLYLNFISKESPYATSAELDKKFLERYGEDGTLWDLVSDETLELFESEISVFKNDLTKVVSDYTS